MINLIYSLKKELNKKEINFIIKKDKMDFIFEVIYGINLLYETRGHRSHFAPSLKERLMQLKSRTFTSLELSKVLNCSRRKAQMTIKKLSEENFIVILGKGSKTSYKLKAACYFLKRIDALEQVKIEDLVIGTGISVLKGALCVINYEGYLDDGILFVSTEQNGSPFELVVGSKKIIQGMSQGLLGMKEGGKRKIFVPATLASGDRQIGSFIHRQSNLIFIIEFIEARLRE